MTLEWLTGETAATCPVCGSGGPKSMVLSTDHVLDARTPVTLLRCSHCGAGFLDDLTIPDYERALAEVLDYYVEQGAGIDLIVAPLRRVPAHTVRRCLEIGCSFGYALDFSRHSFGWDVLGVDPSPLARYGEEALGVPILHEYFSAASDAGSAPFDLVLCSEILEHVAEPYPLLAAILDRLSSEGILILSTPNFEIVRRESEQGMLARALSAGLHLILYDRKSLSRLLAQAGFTDILIEETPETLRAFASRGRGVTARLRPPDPAAEMALLRHYLDFRKREVPADSILASGFGYRHLKECVNAGLYAEAVESRNHLAGVFRERYNLDLESPSTIRAAARSLRGREFGTTQLAEPWATNAAAVPPRHPFNLTGALYFSGMLELSGLCRPDRAAAYFTAAIEAYEILMQSPCPYAFYDGETEALMRQSWKHLPMALAATDPDAAVRTIESLASMDRDRVPLAILIESEDATFVRLVNRGAYDAASQLAPRIASRIRDLGLATDTERPGALDPLYCLAMLALQRDRPAEAADLFGRVRDHAAGAVSDEWRRIHRSAQEHEALALQRLGREGPRTYAAGHLTQISPASQLPFVMSFVMLWRRIVRRYTPGVPAPDTHAPSAGRLLVAERFVAPCARLAHLMLPLDVIARTAPARLRLVVATGDGVAPQQRVATLSNPAIADGGLLRLTFAPFEADAGARFVIGALDTTAATDESDDVDVRMVRAAASGREPIVLECGGVELMSLATTTVEPSELLLLDERAITATLTGRAPVAIPTAHWLDVFWCDANGIYLKGWVHAFEHRVRVLQFESGGRCVRVDRFFDRPDLLTHYPQHDHVRHSGFAVYLPSAPGHPVTMTVETDRGKARVSFPLPDGPLPAWPVDESDGDEVSPTLRRFATLINAEEGRILQIGSRTPPGVEPVPPRDLFTMRITGLDVHPGRHVDLVGDAHVLSRFVRPGSLGAVLSMSLLEHVHAPWVVAAEVNRVLRPGGLVYHHAPSAWPSHAQPNDFWRFSAEGLKSLFGTATGFEVIEARDSGRAAMIPTPQWRKDFLEMPATPLFGMAEILARKVRELEPGEVVWPLAGAGASRAQLYPLDGLRPAPRVLT